MSAPACDGVDSPRMIIDAAQAITFRPMRDDDVAVFHRWIRRPHVLQWWSAEDAVASLDDIRARYSQRALAAGNVHAYLALLGERPIGWTQWYVALGAGDGWWEDETDPGVRGIDQFLCDPALLGRGLGTRMVRAFVAMIFGDPAVTRIQTDPSPDNARAIRCYARAGFRAAGRVVTPDGPALLMLQDRPDASPSLTGST
jgi:aminoglycoside 6'-N-acetyltransferase-1b/aminoglycoside 6'-N-acetyltransferase-2